MLQLLNSCFVWIRLVILICISPEMGDCSGWYQMGVSQTILPKINVFNYPCIGSMIHVWYMYLRFPQTSTIHVGRYTWIRSHGSYGLLITHVLQFPWSQLFDTQYVPATQGQGRPFLLAMCATIGLFWRMTTIPEQILLLARNLHWLDIAEPLDEPARPCHLRNRTGCKVMDEYLPS